MNACALADCATALDGRAAKKAIAADATTSAPAIAMRSCGRRGLERVNQGLVFIDFLTGAQRVEVGVNLRSPETPKDQNENAKHLGRFFLLSDFGRVVAVMPIA